MSKIKYKIFCNVTKKIQINTFLANLQVLVTCGLLLCHTEEYKYMAN